MHTVILDSLGGQQIFEHQLVRMLSETSSSYRLCWHAGNAEALGRATRVRVLNGAGQMLWDGSPDPTSKSVLRADFRLEFKLLAARPATL